MDNRNGVVSIATNMWRFNRPQINRYGIDLLFKLLADYPEKIILYLFVSDDEGYEQKDEIVKSMIPGLESRVRWLYGKSFVEYVDNFDLYVRPNRDDGYGVAIVEALMAGLPAIASDTCVRPEHAILFENENYEDLKEKFETVVRNGNSPPSGIHDTYDWGAQLLQLYKEHL